MMVEKVPDSTYEMVGGLSKQIQEIKEVGALRPIVNPAFADANHKWMSIPQPWWHDSSQMGGQDTVCMTYIMRGRMVRPRCRCPGPILRMAHLRVADPGMLWTPCYPSGHRTSSQAPRTFRSTGHLTAQGSAAVRPPRNGQNTACPRRGAPHRLHLHPRVRLRTCPEIHRRRSVPHHPFRGSVHCEMVVDPLAFFVALTAVFLRGERVCRVPDGS